MKKIVLLLVVLALVSAGAYVYGTSGPRSTSVLSTAPVKRGDLLVTISATGTVEPEEVVDVGAQVAGKIESFGEDPAKPDSPIDYGSQVDVGTVLARIDNALYAADVASNEAQLEQAKANVARMQADLESKIAAQAQADAGVELALVTYNQLVSNPRDSQALIEVQTAEANLKQARAALETAKATVNVSRASVTQAEKAVVQANAALQRARTNLDYCTIRSPVKGVIIDRRVNIGQTVVSSLNAPSLFLIAKDLKRMQVWASVNEADIGSIKPGQGVQFTVDAYPGRTFVGQVGKIRLNATMTQNVVTYTVEVTTDNEDGSLLPYLTANIRFEVTKLTDVLTVPNIALRWTPSPQLIARDVQPEPGGGRAGNGAARSGAGAARGAGEHTAAARPRARVWVADGPFVRPIDVRAGASDGSQTVVAGDDLREGLEVVVGEAPRAAGADDTRNPFMPQMFRNRRQ